MFVSRFLLYPLCFLAGIGLGWLQEFIVDVYRVWKDSRNDRPDQLRDGGQ